MRWLASKARFVALLLPCLVVATATAQAQSKRLEVYVTSGLTTTNFRFNTPQLTSVELSVGVDQTYGLSRLDPKSQNHNIVVQGLQPATTYFYKVVATPVKGKAYVDQGSFKTDPIASTQLSTKAGRLQLDGKPFTPLMVYGYNCATSDYVTTALTLKTSILVEANAGIQKPCDSGSLHSALQGRMWWYNSSPDQGSLADLPELLAGSVKFVEVASYIGDAYGDIKQQPKNAQVVNEINVAPMNDANHANHLSATAFHAQFWITFVGCGDGVEYYAHADTFDGIAIKPDLLPAAKADGSKVEALGPVLSASGGCLPVKHDASSPVKMARWEYGGVHYIIAVNTGITKQVVRFTAPGGTRSNAVVLWENRSETNNHGTITDTFDPLEVHIYKIVP